MKRDDKIFITNSEGLLGRGFERNLRQAGFNNLLSRPQKGLNLYDQSAVSAFFQKEKPACVFLLPAMSGGIKANIERPAEFLYTNLESQTNVLHASWKSKVKKLIFVGASCVYPKDASQPIKEEYLLTGRLEPTSEPYSLSKITGIKMCEYYNQQYKTNFIPVIPATVFGPDDDFREEDSHVIPALIARFHRAIIEKAKSVTIWGDGTAKREFIYIDDFVDACLFIMKNYNENRMINAGIGDDVTIKELALLIKDISGFKGELKFDKNLPAGTARKLLDTGRLFSVGWKPRTNLRSGIQATFQAYIRSLH